MLLLIYCIVLKIYYRSILETVKQIPFTSILFFPTP